MLTATLLQDSEERITWEKQKDNKMLAGYYIQMVISNYFSHFYYYGNDKKKSAEMAKFTG